MNHIFFLLTHRNSFYVKSVLEATNQLAAVFFLESIMQQSVEKNMKMYARRLSYIL